MDGGRGCGGWGEEEWVNKSVLELPADGVEKCVGYCNFSYISAVDVRGE